MQSRCFLSHFNGDETLPMPLLSSFMAPFNPLPA